LRQALYEVLFPAWPVGVRGKTRWLNLLTAAFRIEPYGFLKFRQKGRYRLRLDPGDRNDRYYYFGMVGHAYDRILRSLLKEGDTVLDVGANVGNFAAISAGVVGEKGRVWAIEPNPLLYERLAAMAADVPAGPIKVRHAAAWSCCGSMEFHVATETGWSSLRENATFEKDRSVVVDTITLDHFASQENLSRVALLKLDIEGAETDALLGAKECMGKGVFDHILLEAEPQRLAAFGRSGREIAALMEESGFEPVAIIREDRIQPVPDRERVPGSFNGDYLYCRRPLAGTTIGALFHG
jgi:FkbM family methyltransferase